MAFLFEGKVLAYETIDESSVNYDSTVENVYKACLAASEKYGVPLSEFTIGSRDDYGSRSWEVTFCRPATPEEVKDVMAYEREKDERALAERKKLFEAVKKEFE